MSDVLSAKSKASSLRNRLGLFVMLIGIEISASDSGYFLKLLLFLA